jgi:hypothetical protein
MEPYHFKDFSPHKNATPSAVKIKPTGQNTAWMARRETLVDDVRRFLHVEDYDLAEFAFALLEDHLRLVDSNPQGS